VAAAAAPSTMMHRRPPWHCEETVVTQTETGQLRAKQQTTRRLLVVVAVAWVTVTAAGRRGQEREGQVVF
jgi:hypothetical protein